MNAAPPEIPRRTAWSYDTPLPRVRLSIECFPPRGEEAKARFWESLGRLATVEPAFLSVTCGAGGSGREGTFPLVREIRRRLGLEVAAHLTCAGYARAEVDDLARAYWQSGVRHIVALRGDPPRGSERYEPRPDGYPYAADLVAGLRRIADFEISVAGYPETHPEAPSPAFDLDNLRRKVDAGACRIIGQYCFDTEKVLRFRDRLRRAGITVPFVPGIMPIQNFAQIKRFSRQCGASVPLWLERLFCGVSPGTPLHAMIAASIAAEQCRRLAAEGFDHLHIYALNRASLTLAVCRLLGGADMLSAAA